MTKFDIYLTGVGGQGIGLLSEAITRAADYAGYIVKGTDTHGLAQRGGMVSSHIRLGAHTSSCLIRKECADMVIGMENHESLRGLSEYLKENGTLVFYNTILQPLPVRLGKESEINENILVSEAAKIKAKVFMANYGEIEDPRMQNILLLGTIAKYKLVLNIEVDHYKGALDDLLSGNVLMNNMNIFDKVIDL